MFAQQSHRPITDIYHLITTRYGKTKLSFNNKIVWNIVEQWSIRDKMEEIYNHSNECLSMIIIRITKPTHHSDNDRIFHFNYKTYNTQTHISSQTYHFNLYKSGDFHSRTSLNRYTYPTNQNHRTNYADSVSSIHDTDSEPEYESDQEFEPRYQSTQMEPRYQSAPMEPTYYPTPMEPIPVPAVPDVVQMVHCSCGGCYKPSSMYQHRKTKKHLKYIADNVI